MGRLRVPPAASGMSAMSESRGYSHTTDPSPDESAAVRVVIVDVENPFLTSTAVIRWPTRYGAVWVLAVRGSPLGLVDVPVTGPS